MDIKLKNGDRVKVDIIQKGNMYEYYINNTKIGVYDPKIMEDNILMLQNTLENELSSQIKDGINSIDKSQIEAEAQRNEKILEYVEEQGIERERVKGITVVELKGKEKERDQSDNDRKSSSEEHQGNGENNRQYTTKDINVKQEIDLNERANDMKNLKQWLGGNLPPEARKIAVVESYQMNQYKDENGKEYGNSTRYSLGVIDKDNNIVPLQKYIPSLRQRDSAGTNPTQSKYQVDKSGEVEEDKILSEYEIGDKVIQIDNKEMGRIEVNVGKEEHGGNETLGVQIRDSNTTFATDTETRRVIGEYEANGEYTVDEDLKEAKLHNENDCDKITREDIDGDPNTKSHDHLDKIDFDELATKWGFYMDGKPDAEKAREYLEKQIEENPNKTIEENIEDLTDDFNDDFGGRGARM